MAGGYSLWTGQIHLLVGQKDFLVTVDLHDFLVMAGLHRRRQVEWETPRYSPDLAAPRHRLTLGYLEVSVSKYQLQIQPANLRVTNLGLLEFGVPPSEFEEDVRGKVLEAWFCKRRKLLTSLVSLWMKFIPIGQMWHWRLAVVVSQGGEP